MNGIPPCARLASKFHSACSKAAIRTSSRANAVKDHTTVDDRMDNVSGRRREQLAVDCVFASDALCHYTGSAPKGWYCRGMRGALSGSCFLTLPLSACAQMPAPLRTEGRASAAYAGCGVRIASMRAMTSAVSKGTAARAFMFSCTCEARLAPVITVLTCGFLTHQASASWLIVQPKSPATVCRARTLSMRVGSLSADLSHS